MNRNNWLITAICCLPLFGCASWQKAGTIQPAAETEAVPASKPIAAPLPPPKSNVRAVKSADGLVDGEIVGTPAPNSKFAKLKIGMTLKQVEDLIGQAADSESRVTGKQFQPFYMGGDTQRTEAFYIQEGQLTFSNIHMDSPADTLIRILVNPGLSGRR